MRVTFILLLIAFNVNAQWHLTWVDEFNDAAGTGVDQTYWNYETGLVNPNGEISCYTNSTDNVRHDGAGNLEIVAKNESTTCGTNYSSGRITTQWKFTQLYGKWEVRTNLPNAQGVWPAFWLLGENIAWDGWPACGELDILETVSQDMNRNHGSAHGPGYSGGTPISGTYTLPSGDFSQGYHTYTMEWSPNLIQFYVDGNWFYNFTSANTNPFGPWAFDTPMFIVLNVAIGGTWPIAPNGTGYPDVMSTDYIRVYKWFDQMTISGDTYVAPNEVTNYSVYNDPAYSYIWAVPFGATITSGAGTNEITVDWGSSVGGNVSLTLTDGTNSATPTLFVDVSTNLFENHSFEYDFTTWDVVNGGTSASNIITTDVQHLTKAIQYDVTSIGANSYDIQLTKSDVDLLNGEDYTLKFWAKANQNSKTIQINFLENGGSWTNYHSTQFTLSDTWEEYSVDLTSNVTNPATLFTIDLGYDNSTSYTLDNFNFNIKEDSIASGSNVFDTDNNVNIYNSDGILNVVSKNEKDFNVILRDMSGKQVYNNYFYNEKIFQIDITKYRKGIYVLDLVTPEEVIVRKVINF